MNFKKLITAFACVVLSAGIFAADKLAVAEPVGKGGVPAADIEAFWGILESSIQSDEYTLVSRGALNQMLTESESDDLEKQAENVNRTITDNNIRNMNILAGV